MPKSTPGTSAILRPDLTREVADRAGIPLFKADDAIRAFTDTVRDALATGAAVQLTGFGTFTTSHRSTRAGRNPHTGESVVVPPMRLVVFRPSAALVEEVNA